MANLFIQSAYRNLDAKGRLLLPPEYRDALLAAGDGSFWLTIGLYGGLKAYMPADWEAIVEKLNSVPLPSMKLSHVKTKLLGLAQRMVPDAQGRIRIPQPLMRAAGLQKDVYWWAWRTSSKSGIRPASMPCWWKTSAMKWRPVILI